MGDGQNGKKKRSSSSESGTPDWLRKRREKQARGELREDRGGMGDFAKGDKGDKGDKGKGGGKEPRPGDWKCPSCGSNNFARRTECFKCGTRKPAEGGAGGGKGRNRDSRSRSRGRRWDGTTQLWRASAVLSANWGFARALVCISLQCWNWELEFGMLAPPNQRY